jgi:hypothetical protein
MMKYPAAAILACLLAGCATPQDPGAPAPQQVAKVKKVPCEPPTGSHIVDPKNCGSDAFVRHAVLTDRSGNPLQTQANDPNVK